MPLKCRIRRWTQHSCAAGATNNQKSIQLRIDAHAVEQARLAAYAVQWHAFEYHQGSRQPCIKHLQGVQQLQHVAEQRAPQLRP